jgi:hypothetical protein
MVEFKGFANQKITRFQGILKSENHTFSRLDGCGSMQDVKTVNE